MNYYQLEDDRIYLYKDINGKEPADGQDVFHIEELLANILGISDSEIKPIKF